MLCFLVTELPPNIPTMCQRKILKLKVSKSILESRQGKPFSLKVAARNDHYHEIAELSRDPTVLCIEDAVK